MVIKESTLNRAIDNVENSLETFVLDCKLKSKNWVGMESRIVIQYNTRLDGVLQSEAYTSLTQLEPKDKLTVSKRIRDFLALAKDEYDKN